MAITFTFSDSSTITQDYLTDSLKITEVYYNELAPADNSCSLSVVYSIALYNKLLADADNDILAVVKDKTGTETLFTGYLRHTFTVKRTQKNQPIALEIVSPSFLLKKPLESKIFYEQRTVKQLVIEIAEQVGFTITASQSPSIDDLTMNVYCFKADEGEEAYTILKDLLFEVGYVFDFTAEGYFAVHPVFLTAEEKEAVNPENPEFDELPEFDGADTLNQVTLEKKERKYGGASVSYSHIKGNKVTDDVINNSVTKALFYVYVNLRSTDFCVYIETEGNEDAQLCNIETEEDTYLYGEEAVQMEYASKYGELIHSAFKMFIVTATDSSGANEEKYGRTVGTDQSGQTYYTISCGGYDFTLYDYGTYGILSAPNNEAYTTILKRLKLVSDIYAIENIQDAVTKTGQDEPYEYKSKYLHTSSIMTVSKSQSNLLSFTTVKQTGATAQAKALSQNIADYFRYALFGLKIESKKDLPYGTIVKVTNPEFGTFTGRIVKKMTTLLKYAYDIETITDYTPASAANPLPVRRMDQTEYINAQDIESKKYYQHAVYCDNTTTGANYSTTESRKYVGLYNDTDPEPAETFAIANAKPGIVWSRIQGIDGGYQDYKFLAGPYDMTEEALYSSDDWQDAPPATTAQNPCIYMATKYIENN